MKLSSFSWSLLLIVPLVYNIGILNTFYLILAIVCFFFGFVAQLINHGREQMEIDEQNGAPNDEACPDSHGLPRLLERMRQVEEEQQVAALAAVTGRRLTGSEQIDGALADVINCIMRDFVQSWYAKISGDQVLPQQIKAVLEKVLVKLAQRLHEVEWITYCTQTLTNDFGSHIRLYKRTQRELKEKGRPKTDLEKVFFDMELEMEGNVCREQVCSDKEAEKDYLRQLSEVILFLMIPEEFKDNLLRHLLREILVNYILLPTVDLLADPDYINQNIVWMCKPNSYSFEFLQQSLRLSCHEEELLSMLDPIDAESQRLRGRDSGGEDDAIIKAQLADLRYLRSVCMAQLKAVRERAAFGDEEAADFDDAGEMGVCASFDAIAENNAVLPYFNKFLKAVRAVQLLDIFHRLTGYRTSTEKYIYHAYLNRPASAGSRPPDWTTLREVASSVFAECVRELEEVELSGPLAGARMDACEEAIRRLRGRLRSAEAPNKDMFEELRQAVGDLLRDERLLAAFRQSEAFRQMLVELGCVPAEQEGDVLLDEDELVRGRSGDALSAQAADEADNISVGSADSASIGSNGSKASLSSGGPHALTQQLAGVVVMADVYKSGIIDKERTRDSEERAFAVYVISVTRLTETGQEQWEIYRRYSDFDDLHALITDKHPRIPNLRLPPKRAFNNMKHEVVQQRQRELDVYLKVLLSANNLERYPELRPIVYQFLEPGVWEKKRGNIVRQDSPFRQKMSSIPLGVSTFKSTVRTAMANVKQSADGLMDFLTLDKKAEAGVPQPRQQDAGKMTLGLDLDDPEEVPLRILLLLVEEVFDGKADLRRLLYQVLKRIVRTVFGNKLNAYIVETAQSIASSEQIAEYIRRFREGLWPNGVLAEPRQPRDQATKMRTRVVCRAKMLGSVASELTQYLGTVSTRHGVTRLFDLFQHERLNRRFVYVLMEGWLQLMFPENGLHRLVEKVNNPLLQGRKCAANTSSDQDSLLSSKC